MNKTYTVQLILEAYDTDATIDEVREEICNRLEDGTYQAYAVQITEE